MKRYLLLIMMSVLVSIGTWAADVSGDGISGGTAGYDPKVQTLVITKPGALAQWVADHTGDNFNINNPFGGLGGSDNFYALAISGKLNAADVAALNSETCAAFSRFPRIDMSEVTFNSDEAKAAIYDVNFGAASFQRNSETLSGTGATYIRLPNDMTSEEDVTAMANMKQGGKNANLKIVGAYDPNNSEFDDSSKKWAEVAMHSFEANKVAEFLSFMNMPTSGNPTVVPRDIKMSGEYGDQDLVGSGGPNFGHGTSAKWDFTGAHFADCTIPASNAKYYSYDDPFCENGLVAPSTSSNAFYYFSQYSKGAVDLKLPDVNMTQLPKGTLYEMGKENTNGYKALYGDDAYNANKEGTEGVPFETFVIPECYTDLDEGCAELARIRHLVVGSGVKRIHGGAFLGCPYLEDLDFAAGLADCYIGDRSFNECNNMKHIALSEGIVSLGNGCFWNSQHLESIRLPETLVNMGDHCFDNCLALNSITIPENVEKIGRAAFNLCPFTDVYLTTTDPAKIPYIWTAGTSFSPKDMNSTFYSPDFDGNNGIPNQASEIPSMSWDEAVKWYYVRANGIPVLHYPKELAEKVRAEISSTYGGRTNDDPAYGLPLQGDREKRANIPGADLGSAGTGKFSQDGWAQLMLMKEFTTDPGGDLYFKEYDDVWYTMCFPFDLSDEQLAGAFNETFNIVDFSAVEINKEEKTLTLHFNNVAVTDYKDTEGNHYKRTGDRETDPTSKFSYNVYTDKDGQEYHHVTTSSQLSSNKTKTFAPGTSMENAQANFNANHEVAVMIDGVLATAGHPYMIHPAIGVNDGGTTKKRCNFSGVEWKPQTQWAKIFEENSRTIDLGDDLRAKVDSNYNHPGYPEYAGQKYTFIGNPKEYIDGAQEEIGDEPQVPEEPVFPVQPDQPSETIAMPTETLTEPEALTADEQELVSKLTDGNGEYNRGPWYGITELITAGFNDGSSQWNLYVSQFHIFSPLLSKHGYNCYNGNGGPDAETAFNWCKTTFNKNISYATDYAAYQANKALWDAYNANQAAWNEYNNWDQAAKEAEYNTLKSAYDQAVAAHTTWENKAKAYKVQIPQHAYFLGRAKGSKYPKYYREKAAENYGGTRTTGLWPQFTAVIKVNAAAVNGIESKLDANAALSKGFEMAFNEDFEGEMYEVDEIKSIIEEAEKQGKVDVEYLDVVVNINGQVVRSGSTSLEGLPRGLYIVNGKKYFVK